MNQFCTQCGAPLKPEQRFCNACGQQTHQGGVPRHPDPPTKSTRSRRRWRRDQSAERALRAVATVFVGILVAIAVLSVAQPDDVTAGIAMAATELVLGLIAVSLVGRSAWRAALAGRGSPATLGIAIGAGIATFAFAAAYVYSILSLLDIEGTPEAIGAFQVVSIVVLAPVMEEWLCRGVLWTALTPFTKPAGRNVSAALLFGLLHCLGGLHNFPHRFVSGLVYGWLRHRSGSLLPPIAAHATHNLLAVVVG